jgi:hypothetical protein
MSDVVFRIHPAIGFARVGTSKEYYLAPETLTGHDLGEGQPTGGLPIKKGTEHDTVRSGDLRDATGAMKRQAARFRIYRYDATTGPETYPMGQAGVEIQIGSSVAIGGETRTVADIIWTVHVANKKTAWYESPDDDGIIAWFKVDSNHPKPTPPLRNQGQGQDPHAKERLEKLITDPGPRTIRRKSARPVEFDETTTASYWQAGGGITELPDYPKTFPHNGFKGLYPPGVERIDTLGTLETDEAGRLIVAGGFGRANSFNGKGPAYGFIDAVNNDDWFDDTSDGPVNAVLVFDDDSTAEVQGGAWVVSTDPAYAPQIPNVVSLWDDIYDSWVRKLELRPELFADGAFKGDYEPSFEDEVRPVFLVAGLQRWITNLSTLGISAHDHVAEIAAKTDPASTQLHGLGLIRRPVDPDALTLSNPSDPDKIGDGRGDPEPSGDDRRMPLSLGDAGRSLLSLTMTQHHYLERWHRGDSATTRVALNAGETLDKAALLAGLGGRFSPGIDMTYICREPDLYVKDWQTSGTGAFRISQAKIDYRAIGGAPALSLGWTPRRDQNALEPGDISKFMAIPWHADYNSCGTHLPAPNLPMANTLYWSWPAQRPVAVYVAKDVTDKGKCLADQRFSMRGPGTKTTAQKPPPFGPANPGEVGRYQQQVDPKGKPTGPGIMRILDHWMEIGTVIQATNIDPATEGAAADVEYDPSFYLEVQSHLSDDPKESDAVVPWPNTVRSTEPDEPKRE